VPFLIDEQLARLRRTFGLAELARLAAASGVTGTVVAGTARSPGRRRLGVRCGLECGADVSGGAGVDTESGVSGQLLAAAGIAFSVRASRGDKSGL